MAWKVRDNESLKRFRLELRFGLKIKRSSVTSGIVLADCNIQQNEGYCCLDHYKIDLFINQVQPNWEADLCKVRIMGKS